MTVEIREVVTRSEIKRFVEFQNNLYRDNKYFIPALLGDEIDTLSKDKNPAFERCEAVYFMAYVDGRAVGRIAGIINHLVNEKDGAKRARFGYVDFIDNAEVVDALFDAVEQWARTKGMNEIHGPLGFSDMDPEGMLVEGFDQAGTMVAIYNHPYYVDHVARLGFVKDADWVEYKIQIPAEVPERHKRIAEIVAEKYDLRVVKYTNRKQLVADYGVKLFTLVNEAYNSLYGYSPLTVNQIQHYIDLYLPMLRLENLVLVVDKEGELIGMAVGMPSIAKALQRSRGKLFPFGFIHLLRALWGKNDVAELLLIAVKPEYQSKGVNALIFNDIIPTFNRNGYRYAESNPELELNLKVQNQWQHLERVQHKRRRAFVKSL
ncbi:MAG: N-acetyltransferase [Rikenellaceae bacterium]